MSDAARVTEGRSTLPDSVDTGVLTRAALEELIHSYRVGHAACSEVDIMRTADQALWLVPPFSRCDMADQKQGHVTPGRDENRPLATGEPGSTEQWSPAQDQDGSRVKAERSNRRKVPSDDLDVRDDPTKE